MAGCNVPPPSSKLSYPRMLGFVAGLVMTSGCWGALDDPEGATDTDGNCFSQGGECNGVIVYCNNQFAADDSGGPVGENFWWTECPATPPNTGCNGEEWCCLGEDIETGLCFCKTYSVGSIDGDMGPICVGQGFPAAVDPIDDWVSGSYPTIDAEIRAECSAMCVDRSEGTKTPECDPENWAGHQTRMAWTPSNGFDCSVQAHLNGDDPDGSEVPWDLVGGPSTPIPLSCDLDGDCVDWFYPHVAAFVLTPGIAEVIEAETRTAHYLGVEGTGSQLAVDMPGSFDDTEDMFGMAEYTALDCGETVCPFFLANLSAYNTTDAWSLRVDTVEGKKNKTFSNVQIDLVQSTLGVHNTSLDVVAFAPGALRFAVEFTVEGTGIGAGDHATIIENQDYVFADYDDGSLDLTHAFDIQSGEATLTISVVPDERPPVAAHDLTSSEACDHTGGLRLRGRNLSTDPDNDIVLEMWWIDGTPCVGDCAVPLGTHDVALEAHDARGAVDLTDEHTISVTGAAPCAV